MSSSEPPERETPEQGTPVNESRDASPEASSNTPLDESLGSSPEAPSHEPQKKSRLRTGVRYLGRAAYYLLQPLNPFFYLKHRKAVALGGAGIALGASFLYSDGAVIRLAAEYASRSTAAAREFVHTLGEPSPESVVEDVLKNQENLSRMKEYYRTKIEAGEYDAELVALEKLYGTLHKTFYASLSSPTSAEVAGIQLRECAERAISVVDAAKVRADARLLADGCGAQEKKLADVIAEAEKFDTVVDADPDTASALIEKLRSTFAESRKCVQAAGSVLGVTAVSGGISAGVSAGALAPEPAETVQPVEQRVETAETVLSCFSTVLQRYLSLVEPDDAYRIVLDPAVHELHRHYVPDALAERTLNLALHTLETIHQLPDEGIVYEILRSVESRLSPDAKVQRFREYADDVLGLPYDVRRNAIDYLVQRECETAPERCHTFAGLPLARATPEQAASLFGEYAQKLDPAAQQELHARLDGVQRTLEVNMAAVSAGASAYSSSPHAAAPSVNMPGNSRINPLNPPLDFEDQPRCYESENRRCITDSELENPGVFQRIANKVSNLSNLL